MKSIIFAMSFLVILPLTAIAENFKISGELVVFENKDGLLVKGCEKECLALKKVAEFKKINLEKIRAKEPFHASIGSDVCRLVYKTGSLIGVTKEKDQRAFCVFKDNSLIEINSLSKYLIDKKIVIE
jgi:hypothetical protein